MGRWCPPRGGAGGVHRAGRANWHQAHRVRHISRTGISRPARTSSVILSEALRRTVPHARLWRRPKNPAPPRPMHARLRGTLGRCGRRGRGWSTPRRPAVRRMLRSGILQSRMDAVPEKARRTHRQNDAPAPGWAQDTGRADGAAAGRPCPTAPGCAAPAHGRGLRGRGRRRAVRLPGCRARPGERREPGPGSQCGCGARARTAAGPGAPPAG